MKKTPHTDLVESPVTELFLKSDLNSELKTKTLAAVAKLDSATVCSGCGSGWYNWGGSFGGAGGNWFGDSMCGMNGWCSTGGSRRKHKRNCVRESYTVPHTICEVNDVAKGIRGQAVGTKRKVGTQTNGVGGTLQKHACITLCAEGVTVATDVGSSCSLAGYADQAKAWAQNPGSTSTPECAAGGYVNQNIAGTAQAQEYTCYPDTLITGATAATSDCGKCTPRALVSGECFQCTCNGDSSRTSTADTNAECAPGQFSCTAGTCDPSTHSEIKTAEGHLLCLRRVYPTWT